MEGLLAFLGHNYARCPYNILVHAHFQMVDGATVSPLLTVSDDGGLYNAQWDDEHGLVLTSKRHNPTNVPIETANGEDGEILVRVGDGDKWQRVLFAGLSDNVMRWLLEQSPDARSICGSDAGQLLRESGLCPPQAKEEEEAHPILQATTTTTTTTTATDIPAAEPPQLAKWRYIWLWITLGVIVIVVLAVVGMSSSFKAGKPALTVLSERSATPALPPSSTSTTRTPAAGPAWADGPWIEL